MIKIQPITQEQLSVYQSIPMKIDVKEELNINLQLHSVSYYIKELGQ